MEAEPETKVVSRGSDDPPPIGPTPGAGPTLVAGRYELIHKLGHGGMATVYLARAIGKAGFEKLVAVKVIHAHLASEPEFVEMFLDEARIAARIHHPHVLEILDLGQDNHTFFMVLEYVEGETLSTLIRQLRGLDQALPLSVALQMTADALEGLAVAHELRDPEGRPYGLVHRDVSPQNLLVGLDGWVKVMDFGIMKAAGKRSNTLTGQLRGKLAYMSPEQARGEVVDHRTDLFALGAVLWELCTNKRLFAGDSDAETLDNVARCRVPPLDRTLPELPAEIRHVLRRALAPNVNDRYPSAEAMLTDIRRAQRLQQDDAEPRRVLSRLMKQHFSARADYARAAIRTAQSGVFKLDHQSSDDFPTRMDLSSSSTSLVTTPPLSWKHPGESQTTARAALRSAKHWSLWLLLPLVGAAFGTAVALYKVERTTEPQPPVVAGTTPVTAPLVPNEVADSRVKWVFNTDPSSATVTVDGHQAEGVTPLDVWVPQGADTIEVIFEVPGYEPKHVRLMPVGPENYHFTLQPAGLADVGESGEEDAPLAPRQRRKRRSSTKPSDGRAFDPMPDFDRLHPGKRTSDRRR